MFSLKIEHVCRLIEFISEALRARCNPMRVVTFPESLNGETGLICRHLGGPEEFERTSITDIVWRSKTVHYFFNTTFERLNHAHPESVRAMTVCAKTGGEERG